MKRKHLLSINAQRLSTISIFILCFTNYVISQNTFKEKRIYLLDVTASMEGKDDIGAINIFSEVKDKLSETVKNIESTNGEVVIIPFTNKTHKPVFGELSKKDSIANVIKDIRIMHGETNISAAWERGVQELDSTKINYLFLLTDGIHNYGTTKDFLLSQLKGWEEISKKKYFFGFYVMLTPKSRDNDIAKVINETPQIWCIESMDVMASFVTLPFIMQTNINNQNKTTFSFKPITRYKNDNPHIKVILGENSYYSLVNENIDITKGNLDFELKEKLPHSETPIVTDLILRFEYDKEKYPLLFFTPEEITLRVINRGIRTMQIRILK